MEDSGDLAVQRPPDFEETLNPFTAAYDFEMTFECDSEGTDANGVTQWWYKVTHAKASHPLFKCENGCVPLADGWTNFYLYSNRTGSMQIVFPNEGMFYFENLRVSEDGKRMEIYVTPRKRSDLVAMETIGWAPIKNQDGEDIGGIFVETYNCQQYGGDGSCEVNMLLKNTITLKKVG